MFITLGNLAYFGGPCLIPSPSKKIKLPPPPHVTQEKNPLEKGKENLLIFCNAEDSGPLIAHILMNILLFMFY